MRDNAIKDQYKTLTEAAQDAIFIIDRQDKIIFVNTFGADLFGKNASDIIGKNRKELFPPKISIQQYSSVILPQNSAIVNQSFSFKLKTEKMSQ